MAEIQTAASGNFNSGGTWAGGSPPGASDTFRILGGHTVTISAELLANCLGGTINAGGQLTVAFQMSTSYFNGNITVANGGKIYASRTVSSRLRVAGNIYANGAGAVDYGTAADPISNPAVGACIEMVCTSDNQAGRSIVLGANGALTCYGLTRTLQTTLAQAAAIGANTIVLSDDLALRPGTLTQWANGEADMIIVAHTPIQTPNGNYGDEIDIYLVAGYVSGTKTVTLGDAGAGQTFWPRGGVTPNWNTIDQTRREIGTPVYVLSSNVVIRGSAHNLRPSTLISGAYTANPVNALLLWGFRGGASGCTGGDWTGTCLAGHDHGLASCTACHPTGTISGCTSGLQSCTACHPTGPISGCNSGLSACTACHPTGPISGCNSGLSGCTACHPTGPISGCANGLSGCTACHPTGAISGCTNGLSGCAACNPTGAISECTNGLSSCTACRLSGQTLSNTRDLHRCDSILAQNVAFNGTTEHSEYTNARVWEGGISISRDHDQVLGAYRAWMPGGVVDSDVTVVPPGFARSYKHQCASATRLCFRPETVLVEPGDTLRVVAYFRKDASMAYLPRIQLIDPYQDPLVSDSFTPLAEAIMTNSINTWEQLSVSWQNTGTAPREIIIRACAKGSSGNVYENFDIQGGGGVKIASALGRGRM